MHSICVWLQLFGTARYAKLTIVWYPNRFKFRKMWMGGAAINTPKLVYCLSKEPMFRNCNKNNRFTVWRILICFCVKSNYCMRKTVRNLWQKCRNGHFETFDKASKLCQASEGIFPSVEKLKQLWSKYKWSRYIFICYISKPRD